MNIQLDSLIAVLTNPHVYGLTIGVVAGMYVSWRLCRKTYLVVEKQFSLLWLALLSGWLTLVVAGVVAEWWRLGSWQGIEWGRLIWSIYPEVAESWWRVLPAYLAMIAVTVLYVRAARYPVWKMLDMTSFGLATLQIVLAVAWLAGEWGWSAGAMLATQVVWMALMAVMYRRGSEGMAAAWYGVGVFVSWLMVSIAGWLAWQQPLTTIEWIVGGGSVIIGLGILGWRWWVGRTGLAQDAPKDVSENFRQALAKLRPTPAVDPVLLEQRPALESVASQKAKGVAVLTSDPEKFAPPVQRQVKKLMKPKRSKKPSQKSAEPPSTK